MLHSLSTCVWHLQSPSLELKHFDCKFKNSQGEVLLWEKNVSALSLLPANLYTGELPAGIVNDFKSQITDAIQKLFKKDAPPAIEKVNGLIQTYLADFNVPAACAPK
jgi:hypothetical protein